ncbi:MAG: UPF0175 family protein [Candidatus Methanoperedens sp.]|nr:UPF0175 family protein [Candidatus Methanoperedens sp.]
MGVSDGSIGGFWIKRLLDQILPASAISATDMHTNSNTRCACHESHSASIGGLSFYLNKPKLHKVTKLETVSVDLPKELLHILKVRELDFPKAVRESLAVELYREGLISLGKAAEIAMVSKWEMFEILAAKKVPLQYYPEDLKQDIETLKSALA